MEDRDRFADAVLRDEIRKLNNHLPKARKTLEELLADPSPSVDSVSGHKIRMRREELDRLASSLPEESSRRIKLPLVLIRRRELGPGAFTVLGDPYEEYAVLLLLGSFKGTFQEFKTQTRPVATFYKPQISQLLSKFHSLISVGFGPTGSDR
ncbi:MAG TPA: DUF61 family protein [Candidatus Dormibacteraeota bacterium]|nr:DUF61 family protein [Candidatus Dormibacteraeota bacterium]